VTAQGRQGRSSRKRKPYWQREKTFGPQDQKGNALWRVLYRNSVGGLQGEMEKISKRKKGPMGVHKEIL